MQTDLLHQNEGDWDVQHACCSIYVNPFITGYPSFWFMEVEMENDPVKFGN